MRQNGTLLVGVLTWSAGFLGGQYILFTSFGEEAACAFSVAWVLFLGLSVAALGKGASASKDEVASARDHLADVPCEDGRTTPTSGDVPTRAEALLASAA